MIFAGVWLEADHMNASIWRAFDLAGAMENYCAWQLLLETALMR
jgi:hypothetical protein